jgi:hypothetical protein
MGYPSISIYEGRLFVCFVFGLSDEIHATGMLKIASLVSLVGKLLRRRGASAWFHGVWTCCTKVLEY